MSHCRQLQKGEGLSQSLHELEGAFGEVDLKSGAKEHNLQVERVWIFLTCHCANGYTQAPAVIIDRPMLTLN